MSTRFSRRNSLQVKPGLCKPPPAPLPVPPIGNRQPLWIAVSWSGAAPDPTYPDRTYNYTDTAWVQFSITNNIYRVDFRHGVDTMRIAVTPYPPGNYTSLVASHWVHGLPPRGVSWYDSLIQPGAHWDSNNLYTGGPPYHFRYFHHLVT